MQEKKLIGRRPQSPVIFGCVPFFDLLPSGANRPAGSRIPAKKETTLMAVEQKDEVGFKMDRSKLYREETYSDLKTGTIKRLIPVKPDGSEDKSRKPIFVGHTNLISPDGPVPIQAIIQAKELQQALKKFPEAMQEAVDRLVEEIKKYQEKNQPRIEKPESRIIIPGR
jgi:hypothetical protein